VDGQRVDLLYANGDFTRFASPTDGQKVHGTGCAYSALIAEHLAKGTPLDEAVARSHATVAHARSLAFATKGPMRMFGHLAPDAVQDSHGPATPETARLARTVERLLTVLPPELAPEVGINVALLHPSASAAPAVVALDGRIHRVAGRLVVTGHAVPGSRGHVARVLLAANRAFPEIRAAMNVRYHPAIVEAAKTAGLRVAAFDRAKQPTTSASSLDWGVTGAMKALKEPADLVFDTGGVGKEAMVRLLARDEKELLAKLERLLARLDVRHVTPD
jgi:hydroxymethylpyrimidine/phosphomethylpyrimidine kinase